MRRDLQLRLLRIPAQMRSRRCSCALMRSDRWSRTSLGCIEFLNIYRPRFGAVRAMMLTLKPRVLLLIKGSSVTYSATQVIGRAEKWPVLSYSTIKTCLIFHGLTWSNLPGAVFLTWSRLFFAAHSRARRPPSSLWNWKSAVSRVQKMSHRNRRRREGSRENACLQNRGILTFGIGT